MINDCSYKSTPDCYIGPNQRNLSFLYIHIFAYLLRKIVTLYEQEKGDWPAYTYAKRKLHKHMQQIHQLTPSEAIR